MPRVVCHLVWRCMIKGTKVISHRPNNHTLLNPAMAVKTTEAIQANRTVNSNSLMVAGSIKVEVNTKVEVGVTVVPPLPKIHMGSNIMVNNRHMEAKADINNKGMISIKVVPLPLQINGETEGDMAGLLPRPREIIGSGEAVASSGDRSVDVPMRW